MVCGPPTRSTTRGILATRAAQEAMNDFFHDVKRTTSKWPCLSQFANRSALMKSPSPRGTTPATSIPSSRALASTSPFFLHATTTACPFSFIVRAISSDCTSLPRIDFPSMWIASLTLSPVPPGPPVSGNGVLDPGQHLSRCDRLHHVPFRRAVRWVGTCSFVSVMIDPQILEGPPWTDTPWIRMPENPDDGDIQRARNVNGPGIRREHETASFDDPRESPDSVAHRDCDLCR